LVEIGLVVLEKKSFKGKSWRRTLRHGISSHGLWPGELKMKVPNYLTQVPKLPRDDVSVQVLFLVWNIYYSGSFNSCSCFLTM